MIGLPTSIATAVSGGPVRAAVRANLPPTKSRRCQRLFRWKRSVLWCSGLTSPSRRTIRDTGAGRPTRTCRFPTHSGHHSRDRSSLRGTFAQNFRANPFSRPRARRAGAPFDYTELATALVILQIAVVALFLGRVLSPPVPARSLIRVAAVGLLHVSALTASHSVQVPLTPKWAAGFWRSAAGRSLQDSCNVTIPTLASVTIRFDRVTGMGKRRKPGLVPHGLVRRRRPGAQR